MASPFTAGLRSGGFLALRQPTGPPGADETKERGKINKKNNNSTADMQPTTVEQARSNTTKTNHNGDRRIVQQGSFSMSNLIGNTNPDGVNRLLLSDDAEEIRRPLSGSQLMKKKSPWNGGGDEIGDGSFQATTNVMHSSNHSNRNGPLHADSYSSKGSGDIEVGKSNERLGESAIGKYRHHIVITVK